MIQIDDSIKKVSEKIKALGHPARIAILLLLSGKVKKMSVTDIHENLGLTQPETSRHLSVLKNSAVLNCEKSGSNSYYFINKENSFIRPLANCISKYKG